MRHKKSVLIVVFLLIWLASITSCTKLSSEIAVKNEFEQGNTNGNIHNDGFVTLKNKWLYYTNFNDNDNVYRKNQDGKDIKELADGHMGYEINAIGNWLYYISGSPGEVYKVDIDGKKDILLIDKKVGNLIVTNENIFYRQSFDNDWGKLYKTDLNGKNEILLANNIIEFAVSREWIYYSNREDGSSLYKMNFNGGNITKLNNEYSSSINVDGEFVYYTNYDDNQKLYKIKTDGTNKTMLSHDTCWNVNLYKNYIYYRNQSQKGRIYRMRLDGSENKMIIDKENCVSINVTDNFILFLIPTSTGGYFKANLDGRNIQKW
ncbi:MAG: DUF5050 domain-containing protein [Bacillota bacterium]|nr:DUF5050 domain-containing protein [Bacillota bacterium]